MQGSNDMTYAVIPQHETDTAVLTTLDTAGTCLIVLYFHIIW